MRFHSHPSVRREGNPFLLQKQPLLINAIVFKNSGKAALPVNDPMAGKSIRTCIQGIADCP